MFVRVQTRLPGSMRSGLYPTKKSSPAIRPDPSSSIGTTNSSVVPGYVVDSNTTRAPGRTYRASVRVADSMKERSGRPSVKGVGTVTMATSNPAHERLSVDAWYRPVSTANCRSSAADVLDERFGRIELLYPQLVGVVADDVIADDHASHRQRESDVALSDDDDPGAIAWPRSSWHACIVAQRLRQAAPPWGVSLLPIPYAEARSTSCGAGSVPTGRRA